MNPHQQHAPPSRDEDPSWEKGLFVLLLAIACGSSVFFFFFSSKDMKLAHYKSEWSRKVNLVLDLMVQDIGNAAILEHPFDGAQNQCLFRRPSLVGALDPSLETEGFSFSENQLNHFVKNASGTSIDKPFHNLSNPLMINMKKGQFERIGVRLLKITIVVAPSESTSEPAYFERNVFLKNQ